MERTKGWKPFKGVALSVIEGVADDKWLVNLGSSQHLMGDKSRFETLEIEVLRRVATRTRLRTREFYAQRGLAQLSCGVRRRPKDWSLRRNVMYVFGVATNLIAVSKARPRMHRCCIEKTATVSLRFKGR